MTEVNDSTFCQFEKTESKVVFDTLSISQLKMIMDALTKHCVFPQLMKLMTTGIFEVKAVKDKHITLRKSVVNRDATETDLIKLDN